METLRPSLAPRGARIDAARAREWAVKIGLLAVSTAVTLGAAEAFLRREAHRVLPAGAWFSTAVIFDPLDDLLGFSLRPGASRILTVGGAYTVHDRINALGLRDVERTLERTPGKRRILLLGDSVVFGQGVPFEQILSRRLERRLRDTEVINGGVPGYSLEQEYLFFEHRARRFEPDLVLLGLFMNDLDQPSTMEVERGPDGLPLRYTRSEASRRRIETSAAGALDGASAWLRSRSVLYAYAANTWKSLRSPRAAGARPALHGFPSTGPLRLYRRDPGVSVELAWQRALRTLDALAGSTRRSGARLAIVVFPASFELDGTTFAAWAGRRGADLAALDRKRPHEALSAWCSGSDIPCLDLLDAFEGRRWEDLYFPYDMHPNAEGHRLAAEAIKGFLATHGYD